MKQSRLLQINNGAGSSSINPEHLFLKFKFKEIAIRNYLINLAAAATTAHEYKLKMEHLKGVLKMEQPDKKVKLSKEDKKYCGNKYDWMYSNELVCSLIFFLAFLTFYKTFTATGFVCCIS